MSPHIDVNFNEVADEILPLAPGKYTLEIKHRRYANHREQIEIVGDQTLDLGTKKLTPGGAVRGSVLFAESKDPTPLKMARVELTTLDGTNSETTVSTDGRFRFSGLAAGKYKVRAKALGGKPDSPWGPTETVEVKPGRTARTKLQLPK